MKLSRNYLILFFIYVFTILGMFYFSCVYSNSSDYYDEMNFYDITSTNYDVMYKNVSSYASEVSEFVVYITNDDSYNGKYLFINVNRISRFSDLNRLLVAFGGNSISYDELPVYIVFKNGHIVDISREVVE